MHALGPTACTAHPKVLKNIKKQLEEHNIVSTQELQIARRMGIVATIPVARAGVNDGVVFTPNSAAVALPPRPFFPDAAMTESDPSNRKNGKCAPMEFWRHLSD